MLAAAIRARCRDAEELRGLGWSRQGEQGAWERLDQAMTDAGGGGDPFSIVYGVPTALKIILILPFAIILLTLIMFLQLYRIWSQRRYSAWSRLFYVLITVVSTVALWQLYFWNYIGFNY